MDYSFAKQNGGESVKTGGGIPGWERHTPNSAVSMAMLKVFFFFSLNWKAITAPRSNGGRGLKCRLLFRFAQSQSLVPTSRDIWAPEHESCGMAGEQEARDMPVHWGTDAATAAISCWDATALSSVSCQGQSRVLRNCILSLWPLPDPGVWPSSLSGVEWDDWGGSAAKH